MERLVEGAPPWKTVEWVRSPPWTSVSLPELKFVSWIENPCVEITETKGKIEVLDKEHKWELAKKMVNPYELVYTHNDERLPPSLSLDQPLSRSYYKMIEMLEVLKFFDSATQVKLRTAHIAEGPGGFIQAIHQRSTYKKKIISSSVAMTLRPTTSHVPGWKKAANFLHKYKQVQIHYGEDNTGDIYVKANQESFIKLCKPGVHIFTADGGFDFSVDYACQEQNVFYLLVCSSIIGLQTLLQGGSFILKFFDCNSPHTVNLILLLGRCFKEWTLYKPAMTRPCNSERYFLGRGFRGIIHECLIKFQELEINSRDLKYPISEPIFTSDESVFLEKHIQTGITQQIAFIEHALVLSKSPEIWWTLFLEHCIKHSSLWCETFHVNAIPKVAHKQLMIEKYPQLFISGSCR
jgi:23S rRNA U2552 (ribose-2'-O)-methylase RlmE/FtsJ